MNAILLLADDPTVGIDLVGLLGKGGIVTMLVGAVVILYRAVRESDAEKLVLSKEYRDAVKAEALDAQAARADLAHRMETVEAKLDRLVESHTTLAAKTTPCQYRQAP